MTLYDAGPVVLLVVLAVAGFAALVLSSGPPDGGRAAPPVLLRASDPPPGLARIPPGQLKKQPMVRLVTMTPSVAARYGLRYQQGVLVSEVAVGEGPGMTLLLQRLDLIVAIEGHPVTVEAHLAAQLRRYDRGEWVKLTVWRGGRLITVLVPVAALEG